MKFLQQLYLALFFAFNISTNLLAQGDSPCTAALLTVNTTCINTNGTTVGATFSSSAANFGTPSCATWGAPDVWYYFTAPANGNVTITTSAGTITDGVLALYSATNCSTGGTQIGCDDDGNGLMSLITQSGLTSGAVYYVRVADYGASGDGTFSICITSPNTPANDDCAGAITLTPNTSCTTISGDNANATETQMGCFGGANDDVWYQFVATSTSHTIQVVGSASFDPEFQIFSGTCGGTSVNCVDDDYSDGGTETSTATGLTIGNTYWVRVYDTGYDVPATTTFTICVITVTPPVNDECAGAINVPINTGSTCTLQTAGTLVGASTSPIANGCSGTADDDVWFKFTATATELSININNINGSTTDLYHSVFSGTCGTLTNLICSDPNGSNLTGLTIGVVYYLRIFSYGSTPGETSTFDICILPTPPPPTNITCANMAPICSGSPTVFTAQSTGTSAAVGPNYDCLSTQPNPTWFYLEIDNPGLLSIDISAGSDVDFAIWGPYTSLANSKAACLTYPLPVDCSYSVSATEQANVAGTLNGNHYVLLVTNYANVTQIINIDQSQTAVATTNCAIVLPVEMSVYDVKIIDGKTSIIWITETERNNDYFLVQRSEDGSIWETISIKKGKGTSLVENSYEFFDEKPLIGISYYRLKQVDTDGKYVYTPIRSIKNLPDLDFTIYPIPAKDEVRINTDNKKLDDLQLFDILGSQIEVSYTILNGEYILPISSLKKGVYNVIITVEGKKVNRKLIKA